MTTAIPMTSAQNCQPTGHQICISHCSSAVGGVVPERHQAAKNLRMSSSMVPSLA